MYDVCIIGAGQSGLVSCKTFSENNKNIIVLEKCTDCNGMFANIKEKEYFKWSTSRYMSGFSDFPMDKSLGTWFSIQKYIDYLQSYKKHFQLEKYIQYGAFVEKCNETKEKTWKINYKKDGRKQTIECKYLIVSTGLNNYQKFPEIINDFTGDIYHTQDIYYMDKEKWNKKFKNKKVLLIGGAESAFDIGHVLVNNDSELYYTTKNYIEWFPTGATTEENKERMKKIDNHCLSGILDLFENEPTDLQLNYIEHSLPEPMSAIWHEYGRYFLPFVNMIYFGTYFKYADCTSSVHGHKKLASINKTPNNLFSKYVVKRDEFMLDMYEDKVNIIKFPNKIKGNTVFFEEENINKQIKVDIIVCGTGYKKKIPFLDDCYTKTNYIKKMIPVNTTNLAFIGFARPTMGSIASIAEIQSWWVYKYFYENLQYKQRKFYFRNINLLDLQNDYINTLVNGCYYQKDLAKDLQIEPNMLHLMFHDWELYTTILYNSCHPMIYRIHGQMSTPDSRKILMNTFIPYEKKNKITKSYCFFFIMLHLVYYIVVFIIGFFIIRNLIHAYKFFKTCKNYLFSNQSKRKKNKVKIE
tara:strand:- start:2182 stop:3921 length:1740 start_codon:yes stop_codon:yes gene_type:complete